MLYAYGAVWPSAAAPAVAGIDGAAVSLVSAGELAVAVSRHDGDELKPTRRRLEEHLAVNLALVEAGGVLPFRFGNTFADAEALRQAFEPRGTELAGKLREVEGCVELTVWIEGGGGPSGEPEATRNPGAQIEGGAPRSFASLRMTGGTLGMTGGTGGEGPTGVDKPGTAYLRRKRAEVAAEEAVREQAAEVRKKLGAAVKDFREEVLRSGSGLVMAMLVRRDDVGAVKAALPRASGPWPPSSFV